MKKTVLLTSATILLGVGFQAINASAAETFPKEYNTEGTITFEAGDNEITPPVDPENPDPTDPVDPIDPPGPGTGGALSIDYGSKFKFGTQKISTADQTYYAAPDEMKDGSKKPTYVQVTDKRGTLAGWKLTLSQPEQFKTATGEELVGAQLTFTKAEAASMLDEKYNRAMNAKKETGVGTWVYRFGSNEATNKEAVQLFVPGKSVKLAQQYSTKLVWALEDTPANN